MPRRSHHLCSPAPPQGGAGGSGGATDLSAFCDPGKVRALGFDEAIRCDTKGRTILRQLNLSTAKGWKWAGVGFLIGALAAPSFSARAPTRDTPESCA